MQDGQLNDFQRSMFISLQRKSGTEEVIKRLQRLQLSADNLRNFMRELLNNVTLGNKLAARAAVISNFGEADQKFIFGDQDNLSSSTPNQLRHSASARQRLQMVNKPIDNTSIAFNMVSTMLGDGLIRMFRLSLILAPILCYTQTIATYGLTVMAATFLYTCHSTLKNLEKNIHITFQNCLAEVYQTEGFTGFVSKLYQNSYKDPTWVRFG